MLFIKELTVLSFKLFVFLIDLLSGGKFRLVICDFGLDRFEGNGGLVLNDVVVELGFPLDRVSGAKDVVIEDKDDKGDVEELIA